MKTQVEGNGGIVTDARPEPVRHRPANGQPAGVSALATARNGAGGEAPDARSAHDGACGCAPQSGPNLVWPALDPDEERPWEAAVRLAELHAAKRALCARLEAIADALPNDVHACECLAVAQRLQPTLKAAHRFEEEQIFPRLRRLVGDGPRIGRALERLVFEHWEDESFAEEVADSLRLFVTDPGRRNAEALGYMLRGFFEGLRRHMAFEAEVVRPLTEARRPDA